MHTKEELINDKGVYKGMKMSIEEEFLEKCRKNNEILNKPKKKDLTLTIREDVIEKLKDWEVNISKKVEEFLFYYIIERDDKRQEEGE